MSKYPEKHHAYPSAPPALVDSNDFSQRAPPPSYEESLKMSSTTLPSHYVQQGNPSSMAPSTSSYGYVNPYQVHVQQQQRHYNPPSTGLQSVCVPSTSDAKDKNTNVLLLAKGAKVRMAPNGAISIPPPPPGCMPTPAQLAAMKGQPVLVKKQKGSLF